MQTQKSRRLTGPPYALRLLGLGAVTLLALLLYACQPAPTPTAPPEPTSIPPTATAMATPLPDQSEIHAKLASSMHGYYGDDLYHGPNTWCARCHSPQNWDPQATVGKPPNCFSCKFPTDAEVRVADGNDLIPKDEWIGIPCETCHQVDENGIASEEIAWLNPVSKEYVEVNTPTELCEKCHVTTTNNLFGSAVVHKIYFGSAHLNYAGFVDETSPPQYCTDCHDPHSQEAKQCVDCHAIDEATHSMGKYAEMKDTVTCMACHDASPDWYLQTPSEITWSVGPYGENGLWVPIDATLDGDGVPANTPMISHAIQGEVVCTRCHGVDNQYGLTVLTSKGQIPAPTPTATP